MGKAATRTRHNRTITVDFHDETTYDHLLGDGKAFLEWVLAFLLSLGFQRPAFTCGRGSPGAPCRTLLPQQHWWYSCAS